MASIEADLVAQYTLEAGMLWGTRDAAARHGAYDLAALRALDERVQAHLDGLLLEGDDGWRACKAALGDDPGAVFAATVLAVERGSVAEIGEVLDVAGSSPALSRAMVSGLGWVSFARAQEMLAGLLDAGGPPALQYLGIAGSAVHRRDPGAALGNALVSGDPRLAARACRAAGELGRADLAPEFGSALGAGDAACRFWASWSATLLGVTPPARSASAANAAGVLWSFAVEDGPHAARACRTAMRRLDSAATAEARLRGLGSIRTALAGAASYGDPSFLPWIVEQMRSPEVGRAAGAAFSLITGADLVEDRLRGRPPAGFVPVPNDDPDDETVVDPDENLPWPDVPAVEAWLGRRARDLVRGTRYAWGRPMTSEWLEHVLREGSQPARAAAAEELSIRSPRRVLFEVRAPGFRQHRSLSGA